MISALGLNIQKAHENHIKLWDWLSRNPGKVKYKWDGWERIELENPGVDMDNHNGCFACLVDNELRGGCKSCLFNNEEIVHFYKLWWELSALITNHNNVSLNAMSRLAAKIRDLPIKEEYHSYGTKYINGLYIIEIIYDRGNYIGSIRDFDEEYILYSSIRSNEEGVVNDILNMIRGSGINVI